MRNMRKLFAVVLGLALIIGIMAITSFAATTGTGTQMDPYVCESISDIPATLDLDAGQVVYFTAPIGGQAVTVSDSFGWVCIYNQMGIATGETVYDTTGAPSGYPITFAVGNQNPMRPTTANITVGAPALPDPGTEGNPLPVEYNTNFYAYPMNENLETGDSDGIWYKLVAHTDGILYVDVNCYADVSYNVDVYAGIYQGVASEGNPIITYPVAKDEEIIIHKYVDSDLYGNIPEALIYVSANIVKGEEGSEVPLKTNEVKVPVASGASVAVIDNTRDAAFSGNGLIVSGYADAIKLAVVTINGTEYTDIDGDGQIEITTPGSFMSRPSISIKNNHEWNIAFTFTATEAVSEGPHVHSLIHFEAVEPGCHSLGNVEYWHCTACEGFWTDEACTKLTNSKSVNLPAKGSDKMVHFDAVEPGCHSLGNVEYWFCPDCEGFWTDEACTQITNAKSVNLPAKGSDKVEHVAAVEATCDTDGNIEYWHCAECEGFWTDEACTQLTNAKRVIVPALGHTFVDHEAVAPTCSEGGNIAYQQCSVCGYAQTAGENPMPLGKFQWILGTTEHALVHFDAVEPGCHSLGNVEYWFCPACEGFWLDEACTQITNSKSVNLPAKGSDKVEHVAAVAPTCDTEGNIEYWYCAECEGFWQDEALTQLTNSKNVILPRDHDLVHIEAVEPGCHSLGNIEYWYCTKCEIFWQNIQLTQITNAKNVILPALGSENVEHFEAVAPTCHGLGNIEYWFCPDCEGYWQDEACTQLTNSKRVILPELGSDKLVHVEAVAATTEKEGNIEYWYCPECKAYFQDEACTQLTNAKRVITPKLEAEEKPAETPTTGDATPVAALVVLSVLAVAGMALVVTNKKKFIA